LPEEDYMQTEPFDGVKVLDFTWGIAGPITTKYLADYGATVIRIESPGRPCVLRASAPYKDRTPGIDRAGYFVYFNANKYSLSLNLNHPGAMEVVKKLVVWADIVAESYSPGTLEKWDLDYENLKMIKPDIIMFRTSNQGQDGPHARFSAFGIPLVGLAGFAHFTGWPDRSCLPMPSAYTDFPSPRFAATVLIAALDYKRRTGQGQYIDCSQLEASIHFLAPAMLDYTFNNRQGGRLGNSSPYACPHGVFRCKGEDRWCAIAVFSDEEWQAFCHVIGNPTWSQESRFRTLSDRKSNEDELNKLVEEWTTGFSAEEVMSRMQAGGIAAGVVQNARDLYLDPQLKEREYFWQLNHEVLGLFPHLGQPSRLSKTSAKPRMPAPLVGEHTEYVCSQILGMSDEEFLELYQAGVFD